MKTELLSTPRPNKIVGRDSEIKTIKDAIEKPSTACQVVLITGVGGIGKTRLLQEIENILKVSGEKSKILVSKILDFAEVQISTRSNIMKAIAESLKTGRGADFSKYEAELRKLEAITNGLASPREVEAARKKAENAFHEDYLNNAKHFRRIVLCFDTAERIVKSRPTSAFAKKLIEFSYTQEEGSTITTERWLCAQIEEGNLPNTTILFAGRSRQGDEDEGKELFDNLRQSVETRRSNNTVAGKQEDSSLLEIEVGELKREHLGEYFKAIIDSLPNPDLQVQRKVRLNNLAAAPEKLDLLWKCAEGKPVLISLYADVLVDTDILTDLKLSSEPPKAQKEIQDEFIRLIFQNLESEQMRIVKVLACTPYGLTSDQLAFVLDENFLLTPEEWFQDNHEEKRKKLEKIHQILDWVKDLSFVKYRSIVEPEDMLLEKNNTQPPKYIYSIQDEVYRIYTKRMADKPLDRDSESRWRKYLYIKLRDWVRYQLEQDEAKREKQLLQEDQELVLPSPKDALKVKFSTNSRLNKQREQSLRTRNEIIRLHLERLHYSLLLEPDRNLNDAYFDLTESQWLANDEELDVMAQLVMWSVIKDHASLTFAYLWTWTELKERAESKGIEARKESLDLLLRVADQDAVTRRIKRLVLSGQYHGAVKFCEYIENEITTSLPDPYERNSWEHTLSRGERVCWWEYANILIGENIEKAVSILLETANQLQPLTVTSHKKRSGNTRNERGFKGHPALSRVYRVLANVYNYAGYGKATLGMFMQASRYYGEALKYMSEVGFVVQKATTLNNMSRALSELGQGQRAKRICLDALSLRYKQGSEIPLAISLNTLALIDNDLARPDLAWIEAVKAIAYLRRIGNERWLSLAYVQLGESLRRLANQLKAQKIVGIYDSPEEILEEACRALDSALELLSSGSSESIRTIEALIERGSLLRDQLQYIDEKKHYLTWERNYSDALDNLSSAYEKAVKLNVFRLQLDAKSNTAWTYYRAGDRDKAHKALAEIIDTLIKPYHRNFLFLVEEIAREKLDKLNIHSDETYETYDHKYIFAQLSKIYRLYGHLEMDNYQERRGVIYKDVEERYKERYYRNERPSELETKINQERNMQIRNDSQAQSCLKQAVENFGIALRYAQFFSTRSAALSVIYDALYDYLQTFNTEELQGFWVHVKTFNQKHPPNKLMKLLAINTEDFGNLHDFMKGSFGEYGR